MTTGNILVLMIATFVAGNITGIMVRGFVSRVLLKENTDSAQVFHALSSKDALQTFVAWAITIVWLMSVVLSMADRNFVVSPWVHGLMGTIVGFFFKPEILSITKKKKDDDESK